ncbi:acetoacetate--CoA ligase [Ferrithrix thermotolerans]|uniref:acetoacetate--CoA ligase n=1 Tax=Ferrithrix thermotolerans TaxID=209649 RepID=UPI0009FC2AC0|nr:acetoacetate--CoA ligase [Ferrithrix thermotolerans]
MERKIRLTQKAKTFHKPSQYDLNSSNIARFIDYLEQHLGREFPNYDSLHNFSVEEMEEFWVLWWNYFAETSRVTHLSPKLQIKRKQDVLTSRDAERARWLSDSSFRLNYAQLALACANESEAVVQIDEDGKTTSYTKESLAKLVGRVANQLKQVGLSKGDVVCGYLTNSVASLVGLLATASIGAIWSSCSPEFGTRAVLDRFAQLSPKFLLATTSYRFNGKKFDKEENLKEIIRGLPSLKAVMLTALEDARDAHSLASLAAFERTVLCFEDVINSGDHDMFFEPMEFSDPLWILFSSGTTGLPKGIVQSHGGIVFEHSKVLSLHLDLGPGSRFFWYTTTGWMMWNFLVSGVLTGATVLLYDGSPTYIEVEHTFKVCAQNQVTHLGTSAPYLASCMRSQVDLGKLGLESVKTIGSTGAPLTGDVYHWVYSHLSSDVSLVSASGGTDLCTAFLGSSPLHEIREGEISCAMLGADVAVFDDKGDEVVDQVGELVIRNPMPSMPLYFWNDHDRLRLHEAYFATFEGAWRHGDWAEKRSDGGYIVYGRSDATLNRDGVRMGTADFYAVVEGVAGVKDSLVVDTSGFEKNGRLVLFVVTDARELDSYLKETIRDAIRRELSPRHVPDIIEAIQSVPRTINGKKMEVPIRKAFGATFLRDAVSEGSMANPESIEDLQTVIDRLKLQR